MNVLFVTDGLSVPASRFRCEQFFSHFESSGIRCSLRYAYGPRYNDAISTRWGTPYKVLSRLRRGIHEVLPSRGTDVVFLQRTAFPQTAVFEEMLKVRGIPTIFDFDDNLSVAAGGTESRRRRATFERAADLADHVIAGNEFLAEQANQPHKTTIIPTVIDTDVYTPAPRQDGPVTIGWMGTAGNFPFLEQVVPSLKATLAARPNARVRLVSNAPFKPLLNVDRVEQIPWSAATEVSLLQSFDIGLMPLIDSPLTRGKCAFKMIQYMAVGSPVVVSAVGANVEVFGQTELGHLLTGFDWTEALIDLIDHPERRQAFGETGRARAVAHYSIHAVLPEYLRIFHLVSGR